MFYDVWQQGSCVILLKYVYDNFASIKFTNNDNNLILRKDNFVKIV